jgi:hypothetical protein
MKKLTLLLLVLGASLACEKEIDFTIPNPGTKITVDTRLVAGEPIKAWLSKSVYSLDPGDPSPSDGFEARLYDGNNQLIEILYSNELAPEGETVYQSNYFVEADKSSRFEVGYPGLKTVQSTVYVPQNRAATCVNWDNNLREVNFCLDQKFRGWYRISLVSNQVIGDEPYIFSTISPGLEVFEFSFGDFEADFNRTYGNFAYLSSGALENNNVFSLRIEDPSIDLSQGFYLKVERISEAYYRHEKTKTAQEFSDGFFTEPIQIFFNVENGYGIVGTSAPHFNFVNTQ